MDPADIYNLFAIGYRPQHIVRSIVMQSGRSLSVGLKKDTMLQEYAVLGDFEIACGRVTDISRSCQPEKLIPLLP